MRPQWVKRRWVLQHQLYAVTLAIRRLSSKTLICSYFVGNRFGSCIARGSIPSSYEETNLPKEATRLKQVLTVVISLLLAGCSTTPTSNNNQPGQPAAAASQSSQAAAATKPISELKEGEASGTIVDEGQTINLKYAYAGHGKMFDEDAVVILLTEAAIAPNDLAKAFETFPSATRGLHYNIGKGFWVKYNPSGFQTSGINTLKGYSVENGVVRGRDEDSTNFSGKDYKRSVSFVARLLEKN